MSESREANLMLSFSSFIESAKNPAIDLESAGKVLETTPRALKALNRTCECYSFELQL